MMVKSDIYFGAAKTIEELGHTKGRLKDKNTGAVCLYGALWCILGEDASTDEMAKVSESLFETVFGYLPKYSDHYELSSPLVSWNNDPVRTATEVIDALNYTGKMVKELEDTNENL